MNIEVCIKRGAISKVYPIILSNILIYQCILKFIKYTDYHRFSYRHASYFIQHEIHNILKPEVAEYEAVLYSQRCIKARAQSQLQLFGMSTISHNLYGTVAQR